MLTLLNKLHFALLALALVGCSHIAKRECMVRDWYEQGRIDGSQGRGSDRLAGHLSSCSDSPEEVSQVYINGWNAGLTQYCSPQNGFELGAAGRSYSEVCPPLLERVFLAEYQKGQKLLQLEEQNARIESELANLTAQRSPASTESGGEVSQQIRQLLAQREANEREIHRIRNSVQLSL